MNDMRAGQALIEKYWAGVYTGDAQLLNNLLAPDIDVTIIQPDGSRQYLNSSTQLIALDQKISSAIDAVLSTSRNYTFAPPVTQVNFAHRIALTTKDVMQSEGCQNWTTKIVNEILVLASLVVSEVPVSKIPVTHRISA